MCYFPTVPLLGRDSAFLGLLSQLSSIYLSSSFQNFGAMVPFSHSQLFFLVGLEFALRTLYKAGALLLEPHLQSILLWLFLSWGLENYLPALAWNCDSPDLSLPCS
jgi:hypothetical protein